MSSGPVTAARLRITTPRPGEVTLAGVVDESARIGELLTHAVNGRLQLDLGDVNYINSVGVRDWIDFLRRASADGIAVELLRVSEPVVQQFNMIIAARGNARVRSFMAPYACDACGHEESRFINVAEHLPELIAGRAPPATCPACQATLVFDDFPERYFAFLTDLAPSRS